MKFANVFLFLALVTSEALAGNAVQIKTIDFTSSISRRSDGLFDVVCIDGSSEVRSGDQIRANQVCVHITRATRAAPLQRGGVVDNLRMCDLNVEALESRGRAFQLQLRFLPPCAQDVAAQNCAAPGNCDGNLQFGTEPYRLTMVSGGFELTRLKDNLSGFFSYFQGNEKLRLFNVGAFNILQFQHEGNWGGVCDDGFDQADAEVACRQMGFSGVVGFQPYISYNGQGAGQFTLDDLGCTGSEANILDCGHSPEGTHNCANGEHVSLTCR